MIGFAKITNGIYRGKTYEGTFEAKSEWQPWPRNGRDGFIYVLIDGKQRGVGVNRVDCVIERNINQDTVESVAPTKEELQAMTAEENAKLEAEISKRFRVMNTILKGVVEGDIPSVMPYEWMNITDYGTRVSNRYTHQANSTYFSDTSHRFVLKVFNSLSVGTGAPLS